MIFSSFSYPDKASPGNNHLRQVGKIFTVLNNNCQEYLPGLPGVPLAS